MIILQSIWFCKLLGIRGIMLFPFIIVKDKKDKVLIQHEKIHIEQAKELWVIGFYWLYFKYYFRNRRIYKGHPSIKHIWSYRNIPFEEEAFACQSQLDYLEYRKPKAWKKYIAAG
jgi:hypothetical protein